MGLRVTPSRTRTAGDSSYAAKTPARPALTFSMLPGHLNNQIEVNAVAFTRDNVVTLPSGVQYAVWWDARKMPLIGKRAVGSDIWTTYDLSSVTGNPLGAPVLSDGHNNISVGVDSAGYVHVSGNHHNVPLRYVRTTSPGDITSWTTGMVGTQENSVTYPLFVNLPDGRLLFIYRNGESGDGDVYINRFDTSTLTWSRVSNPLAGSGLTPVQSPYLNQPCVGPDGTLGLFVVYRISNQASGNHDLGYIKSADGGVTWTDAAGAPLTIPVAASGVTAGATGSLLPLAKASSGYGLINQSGAAIDSQGRPHTAVWLNDTSPPGGANLTLHHIYWSGTAWVDELVIPSLNNGGQASTTLISRVSTVCTNDGRTLLIYRKNRADPDSLWVHDVTPDQPRLEPFRLCAIDLGGYEPTFDYTAVRTRNELNLLLTPVFRSGTACDSSIGAWSGQWGAILSVDLTQLGQVAAGLVETPRVLPIGSASGTATTSSNTFADATAVVPVKPRAGQVLLARATVSGASGAGTVSLRQRAAGSVDTELCRLPVASGGVVPATTVAAGSNGATATSYLGSGTLTVATTTGFPTTGTLLVRVGSPNVGDIGSVLIDYTGTTGTTFTGCTAHLGGITGRTMLYTGAPVTLALVAASPWQPVRLDLGDFTGGGKLVPRIAAPAALTLDSLSVEIGVLGLTSRPAFYTAPLGVVESMLGKLAGSWRFTKPSFPWANDAAMDSLDDKSGNGWTLFQSVNVNKPTYKTAGINGAPAALFSGNQVLRTTTAKPISLGVGFAVVAAVAVTGTGATQIIAASDDSTTTATRIFQLRADGTANTINSIVFDGTGNTTATSAALTLATPRVVCLQRDAAMVALEQNGGDVLGRTANAGDTPNGAAAGQFSLGMRNIGTGDGMTGYIGDTMAFAAPLSPAEAIAAQAIIANRYGITLA